MKKHLGFIIFFSAVITVFLGGLISMKAAFLGGDYLVQFYPWSKIYSEAIRNFSFPFWTRYFHSGFPLMAEGQIGGFYPLNIIMFFSLPFNIAYNYSVVLHFILAGVFTYLYARKIGAGQGGGALAALLFCFGSAYAGCFYNTATLKTLAWFPLVLLLIDRHIVTRKPPYIIIAGAIAGMQFLAGFLQMAVYSFIFYLAYIIYGSKIKNTGIKNTAISLFLFVALCAAVAYPQVILTYQLAGFSTRESASLGFALWGSFPPPCLSSMFFPYWMSFLGHQLFIGVLSLLFLIYAILRIRLYPQAKPLILITSIAFLAALGRYNPVYTAIIKMGGFYWLRNPSKFLFFVLFGFSILAGLGFSNFFKQKEAQSARRASAIFSIVSLTALILFFITKLILLVFENGIISLFQSYVHKYVLDKPYHRYSIQQYMDKAENIYRALVDNSILSNIFILSSVVIVLISISIGIYLYAKPAKARLLRWPIFGLIFLDIFVYSFYGTGFRGNIKPFDYLKPQKYGILQILKSDKEIYRTMPFGLTADNMPAWAKPNANILYGIDTIAAYTPLAQKGYKEALSGLEVVDDSLGLIQSLPKSLPGKYNILRLLNVKYILSAQRLDYGFLRRIAEEDDVFLYSLEGYLPRCFFSNDIVGEIIPDKAASINLLEYRDGLTMIEMETRKDGYLVFSENYYPGWVVYVDGTKGNLISVKGLIQAVHLKKGRHAVSFKYAPFLMR